MTIADTELLRARWRRTLDLHALDDARRSDFALGGLATRLREPTVQVLLLPPDPDADALPVDDALWTWLEAQKTIAVDDRAVRFGDQKYPTAHAAALVSSYGEQGALEQLPRCTPLGRDRTWARRPRRGCPELRGTWVAVPMVIRRRPPCCSRSARC